MPKQRVPGGVAHKLPDDLHETLLANAAALKAWTNDLTPLARNEFICWVEDANEPASRSHRSSVARIAPLGCASKSTRSRWRITVTGARRRQRVVTRRRVPHSHVR